MNSVANSCFKLLVVIVSLTTIVRPSRAQVLFYGGDYDGRIGSPSEWGSTDPTAITFDDFSLSSTASIGSIWGNFGMNFIPTQAYYQIRSGVSAGNGGTLISSGTMSVEVTPTGLSQQGSTEYKVLGNISLTLGPGTYWLGIAPVGTFFDFAYVSSASGGDEGAAGNPPPTGSPLADGNSFIYDPDGYDYVPVTDIAGPGTWDFSYGVAAVPEPQTSSLLILSCLIALISYFRTRLRRAT